MGDEERLNNIENTLTNIENITKENKVKSEKDFLYYATSRIAVLIYFFIAIFTTPLFDYVLNSYSYLFDFLGNNQILKNNFGNTIVEWMTTLILSFLGIIPFIFLLTSETNRIKIISKIFNLVIIMLIIFGIWGYYSNNFISNEEAGKQALETAQENSISAWLNFKCNSLGVLNEKDAECIQLRESMKLNSAKTIKRETISIQPIKFDFNQMELFSKDDYFPVKYKFDSNKKIKLTKLECYTSKNSKVPFYNKTFENEIIEGKTEIEFECYNIASILEEKKEEIKIESKLYFEVESSYTQDILSINCLSEDIINQNNNQIGNCKYLSLDNIKEKIGSIRIPEYEKNIQGGNTLKIKSSNVDILHIGDEIQKQFKYILEIKGKSEIGTIVSTQITNIEFPNVLLEEKKFSSKREDIIAKDDSIQISIGLKENDEIKLNEDITKQNIKISIKSTLYVKSGTSNKIEIIANFIQTKSELTSNKEILNSNNEKFYSKFVFLGFFRNQILDNTIKDSNSETINKIDRTINTGESLINYNYKELDSSNTKVDEYNSKLNLFEQQIKEVESLLIKYNPELKNNENIEKLVTNFYSQIK